MLAKKLTSDWQVFNDVIRVPSGEVELVAELLVPEVADGIVVFCHGARNRRHGGVNRSVAEALAEARLGSVICNLLSPAEEAIDERKAGLRFEMSRLAGRLADLTDELGRNERTHHLPIAYFGASTAAAVALVAAASRPLVVHAVVSLGGLPDLAGPALREVEAPTLLLVGEHDWKIMARNQEALESLRAEKDLCVVPGGTHLFSEPDALEEASRLAREWFKRHLNLVPEPA